MDFPGWQNLLVPADVNNDGAVSSADLLLIVRDLYTTGSRCLTPAASTGGLGLAGLSEGPGPAPMDESGTQPPDASHPYLDVNGDGYLTPADALIVVRHLISLDETDVVAFRLETTDANGVVTNVFRGDTFQLNVYVQDIRPDTVANRGVVLAYLDVMFDNTLVSPSAPFTFGPDYQDQTSGDLNTAGELNEAGGTQTDFATNGPLGPGDFLLFSVLFQATATGVATFMGDPADSSPFHDVVVGMADPPYQLTVSAADIFYGTTTLTITEAVVAVDDTSFAVDEDSPETSLDVLGNDDFFSTGTLTVMDVGPTDNGGTVTVSPDGLSVLYTPALNFYGDETFTYTATDGLGHTALGTVVVTVNPVNDAPEAANDSGTGFRTDEDAPFTTANVLANDDDVDGDTLTVIDFDPTGTLGIVTYNGDGTFDYDPNGQFDYLAFGQHATDTFTYTVTDGEFQSTATVSITINGGPPVGSVLFRLDTTDLSGQPITDIAQGQSFLLQVYVQDIRPEGELNRGVVLAYLDVTFDAGLVSPSALFTFGSDYLDQTSGDIGTAGVVNEAGGTQTDFGLNGPLGSGEFFLFSVPFLAMVPGTVTFAGDPADVTPQHDVVVGMPDPPYLLSVLSSDMAFGTATLTINAGPVVARPDAFTVNEDSTATDLNVLANDEINTAGTLVITGVGPTNHGGTVANAGTHLVYTPAHDFHGTETFTYTIGDGLGHTAQAAVVVTVDSVNDPPVAHDDIGAGYRTTQSAAFTTANVLANDTDVDGDTLTVLSVNTAGTKGLVTNNGDGTFNYNPDGQFDYLALGQQATDTFRYTVTDGQYQSTAIVTITVTATPPAPADVMGYVFADVDNDGQFDSMERAIGGVEIWLEGTDVTGSPVSIRTFTDALGRYGFKGIIPGEYVITEIQPKFFLDGIDTVNGVVHTGPNDRVTISANTNLASLRVNFGERSLAPEFISTADFVNPLLRQGIVIGFDPAKNQVWYSLLDGWEGVTGVHVTLSGDGSTATVTVTNGASGDYTFSVPTAPQQGKYRVKGETAEGKVVQIIGTSAAYLPSGFTGLAENEPVPNMESVDAVFAGLSGEAIPDLLGELAGSL